MAEKRHAMIPCYGVYKDYLDYLGLLQNLHLAAIVTKLNMLFSLSSYTLLELIVRSIIRIVSVRVWNDLFNRHT